MTPEQAAIDCLKRIVCTEEPDAGVVLLSNDGPCTFHEGVGQVYDHEYFSPLGDALMELHGHLQSLAAEAAALRAELEELRAECNRREWPLVELFRGEEREAGAHGDDRHWPPAKTAVWLIRELRHQSEAARRERSIAEAAQVASMAEVERLKRPAEAWNHLYDAVEALCETPDPDASSDAKVDAYIDMYRKMKQQLTAAKARAESAEASLAEANKAIWAKSQELQKVREALSSPDKLFASQLEVAAAAEVRKLQAALAEANARAERAEGFIGREGYRRCDIAACNCGSWHGGTALKRLMEIVEVLKEGGCQPMEKTALVAVRELLQERDELKARSDDATPPAS